MENNNLNDFSKFAKKAHDDANCTYDGKNYYTHVSMVEFGIKKYSNIFIYNKDLTIARAGAIGHDLVEDTRLTFNDIKDETNSEVARVVLAVTDVPEENRLLRHLFTMGKTMKNHIAIIVKMVDIRANALYSRNSGSTMYKKYVAEYEYRRPIFKLALKWYEDKLNMDELEKLWDELDEIHGFNK